MSGIWARAERRKLEFQVMLNGVAVDYFDATDDASARQRAYDRAAEFAEKIKIKKVTVERVESFHDLREAVWPPADDDGGPIL